MIYKSLVAAAFFCVLTLGAREGRHDGGHGDDHDNNHNRRMVYIESNIGHVPGKNSILAFRRDASGKLTAAGEFLTGGTGVHPQDISLGNLAGTLGPFDSDQNVIMNKDGTLLYAVNSGSDTIAVFEVKSDGSLKAVKGSPFPSGGKHPVSLGLADNESVLVVVNKDYDLSRPGFDPTKRNPNYASFRTNKQGKLASEPKSIIRAGKNIGIGPGNSSPSQALVSPNGDLVFDADTFGSTIHSFEVESNGRLERADSELTPASEFIAFPPLANPAGRPFVLGLAAHPRKSIVYAGFVFESRMGVYTYNKDGALKFVRATDAGFGICWIVTNRAGDRVYTSNTLVNSISVLDSSDALKPVKVQDFALAGPPAGSEQMSLDSRGEYLYVITQKALDIMPPEACALHVLKIGSDGKIEAQTDRVVIPVSPSNPQGVVAQ